MMKKATDKDLERMGYRTVVCLEDNIYFSVKKAEINDEGHLVVFGILRDRYGPIAEKEFVIECFNNGDKPESVLDLFTKEWW